MREYSHDTISLLTRGERHEYLCELEKVLQPEYRLKDAGEGPVLPVFEHLHSHLDFRFIAGGTFTIGLTESQERAARSIKSPLPFNLSKMQPAVEKHVSSFLMSAEPMLISVVKRLFGESELSEDDLWAGESCTASVKREAALAMAKSLGCRLPYETEWEYACRGNTTTLFVWGDSLLPRKELDAWVRLDGLAPQEWRGNTFGLKGMFSGDWCMDNWKASHADEAEDHAGVFVIKGGGSTFWPWQDDEWIWCMPAMRMPSTGLLQDKRCSFRLVRELSK